MKGGAAGGGYAQVHPMEDINLHFTGDFHAITSAHNMITALLDNYLYQNRGISGFALKEVLWKRVLDVNDRSLRRIVKGLGGSVNGTPEETGFDITSASEIMAILCLSKDLDDLKKRIGEILLGFNFNDNPLKVKDLCIEGAIAVLMKNAINPNLVQTTEHTAAFIHGGPFADIAHGCNSIVATEMALTFGDYAVTEAGFGADLGAERFFNIKCRKAGLQPKLTIIVVTSQGLRMHGGVLLNDINKPDKSGFVKGFANLDRHIRNLKKFGQSVVVAFNKYATDTDEEIALLWEHCFEQGVGFAVDNAFAEGGNGARELAQLVVDTVEKEPSAPLRFTYDESDPVKTKIEKIACDIYGAESVIFSERAERILKLVKQMNIEHYPVCIAKTQYSFSADPKAYGAENGFKLRINDIVINNGAEFIVAITGEIMRMPGLPKNPQAVNIDIVNGEVKGLS
jgi:formate--tetrahydrofolate ligase